MKRFTSKKDYLKNFAQFEGLVDDDLVRDKTNNDILFYKWMLDKGITRFKGGYREALVLTWRFYKDLTKKVKSGVASKMEIRCLEQFIEANGLLEAWGK